MNFESKDFLLRDGDKPVVIAEVGVNHNGSPAIARQMVDAAVEAGVDVVKFQAFISEKEISRYAAKTPYQKETTSDAGNQLEMCRALEIKPDTLREMKRYCAERGAAFLCAAFEHDTVDLLADELRVSTIKIASSEVTNLPFLEYVARKKVSIVLSTGASTLTEVGQAVDTLRKAHCQDLMLFHCISAYPAPFEQVNLRAMQTLKTAFGLPVGFSDHTIGCQAGIAASALGAAAIEKHFTLDRTMSGPDHRSSIEPHELAELVEGVKLAHLMLGDGVKRPVACELDNLPLIRKSLVASRALVKGTRLEASMLEAKRPEGGILPADFSKIIGLVLTHDLEEDQPITWDHLR